MAHVDQLQRIVDNLRVFRIVHLHDGLVRGPSHDDDILHEEIEAEMVVLGDYRQTFGVLPEGEVLGGKATEENLPGVGLQGAVDSFQQSRLSASVGSDESDELPLPDVYVRPVDDLLLRNGHSDLLDVYVEHRHRSVAPNP